MPPQGQALIFGEVLFDRFPDGKVVLGGAPFNVAWHLQAFGAAPLFVSRVGNDSLGRRIRGAMSDWGMDGAGLQLDSQHPTGSVEVSFEQGEPAYDIVAERAYDFVSADAIPAAQPALLYHGTLAVRGAVSARALQAIKARFKAPVFLDVNLRPPWWDRDSAARALDDARWVKLNEAELIQLGAESGTLEERAAALQHKHSIELLIVTRGGDGAIAFAADGSSAEIRPDADQEVVDTVGAGDAFTSVCILGLLRDWPLQQTLERAQAFASALVGVRGATVQEHSFYRPFSEHWGLTAG
jgi:fructokinase